jgi:hypothetical protein
VLAEKLRFKLHHVRFSDGCYEQAGLKLGFRILYAGKYRWLNGSVSGVSCKNDKTVDSRGLYGAQGRTSDLLKNRASRLAKKPPLPSVCYF